MMGRVRSLVRPGLGIVVVTAVVVLGAAVASTASTTVPVRRVSAQASSTGGFVQPPGPTDPVVETPVLSGDGRYVAFSSTLSNLVSGDTNGASDVFVTDRTTGTTTRISVSSAGAQADGDSYLPSMSADGRYVAFTSGATNLIGGQTVNVPSVYLHDRQTGSTVLVSTDQSGGPLTHLPGATTGPGQQAVSDDGRYVVFQSSDTVTPGAGNGSRVDVYLTDLSTHTTVRLSTGAGAAAPDGSSFDPVISGDGSHVAFESAATNLTSGDGNGHLDVFVRDLVGNATTLASVSTSGAQGNADSSQPSIAHDGSVVAFQSLASNLVGSDGNGASDVFVRDLAHNTTTLSSVSTGGGSGNGASADSRLSRDGSTVAFDSRANNLVAGDTNGATDVFAFSRGAGTVVRVSVASDGSQANGASGAPALNAGGDLAGFVSSASNLAPGTGGGRPGLFIRDVTTGTTIDGNPGALPNLVKDGSFEPPDFPDVGGGFNSYGTPDTDHLGAWQFATGGIDVIGSGTVHPTDGAQSIDTNGNGYGPVTMTQSIPLTDHHLYDVSFSLASNPNGGPVVKTMDVTFGGQVHTFTSDSTGSTPLDPNWRTASFRVPACGTTSSVLTFQSKDDGDRGTLLDAVTVYDVTDANAPDPCTKPPPAKTATRTTVTAAPNPATAGQPVTLTAAVAPTQGSGTPTGTVQFSDGSNPLGTPVTLANGSASMTTSSLAAGQHQITAAYSGDNTFAPSTSPPVTVTVNAAPPNGSTPDDAYVTALYHDFLGRTPGSSELDYWTGHLAFGVPRSQVALSIAGSDESVHRYVNAAYAYILGRVADRGGADYWAGQIEHQQLTINQFNADLYASEEYFLDAGRTIKGWVDDLYFDVMGRQPDSAGEAYWVAQAQAHGRLAVAYPFFTSNESAAIQATELYAALLGRAPDAQGLAYYGSRIKQNGYLFEEAEMAWSNEYYADAQKRYG